MDILSQHHRFIFSQDHWLTVSKSHARSLVCESFEEAQQKRGCLPAFFHSDRGTQYVPDEVEAKLKTVSISMSRKGHCWDNANKEIEENRGTLYDDEVAEICPHLIRDEGFTFSEPESR